MGLDTDGVAIAAHAEQVLPLATASLGDEYRYQSLPLCVIDAVFSISIRYAIVQGVVARYCDYTKQRRVRPSGELPPRAEQEGISSFCDRPEQAEPAIMAERVYGSRNLTSPRGGILKAEAALRFARCLRAHGVEHLQDVPSVAASDPFEADIRAIPGQGSGLSLQYFWMLAGSEEFIKPDRMVLRFLTAALSRPVAAGEALMLLRAACSRLAGRYPGLTPRLLDYEVWKHQRAAKSTEQDATADGGAVTALGTLRPYPPPRR